MLPLFKGIENYHGGADDVRGRGGPVPDHRYRRERPALRQPVRGRRKHRDPAQPGLQQRRAGRHRDDAGLDRRRPAHEHREGLSRSGARAAQPHDRDRRARECLLFEGNRCVGVRYTMQGQTFEARAAREVIVSAGSIASPQLLELSGIGQADRLKALGIEVKHELPRRRREPARPLGAAHEVARRPPRRHLQRARARPAGLWQGLLYIFARARASSAIRLRRCAPSSRRREGLDCARRAARAAADLS